MRIQCLLASVIFAGGTLPLHAQPTASAAVSLAPSQALADLFAKSDADNLARNPVSRLFRGDTSASGKLGNPLSDAAYAAERAAAERELAALARIEIGRAHV